MFFFHDVHIGADEVAGLAIAVMMLGGLSTAAVVMIAREIGRQRIARNLLRERLARHWASVPTVTPPSS